MLMSLPLSPVDPRKLMEGPIIQTGGGFRHEKHLKFGGDSDHPPPSPTRVRYKVEHLKHVTDLATEYSYRPPRSAVRKHRAKKLQLSHQRPRQGLRPPLSGSDLPRRPVGTTVECYAAESAAEITNQYVGDARDNTCLKHREKPNEATLVFLEASCDQDVEMRLLRYQIDRSWNYNFASSKTT
ncbi:hypothetical protein HPB51_024622 [Rhipicephalus microplus]|uniref:Uncharacterized protein n=1 Tax=Rhipicephalus microplus TaxID=6941 RepID=A0A9J6F8A1_RHIMP|nr:hypothetical protein HPB51_024622 [Rhipicephalus microplus]